MELICCTKIQGNPRHRIETCFVRKEKAKVLSKKEHSLGWKHGATGVTGDYFFNICDSCDPTEMKTIKVDTSQFTAPNMTNIRKKEVVMVKQKEPRPTHKPKYICKCGFGTDDTAKFIIEQGVCRKCYMKEWYEKNPRKSKPEQKTPRKSRQGEDAVDMMLARTPKGKILDIPVKDLTLKDVLRVGGEVSLGKPKKVVVKVGEKKDATERQEANQDWADGMERFFGPTDDEVVVDFAMYPDLLVFLKEVAAIDFRSPKMQILAILNDLKGREKPKKEEKCQRI